MTIATNSGSAFGYGHRTLPPVRGVTHRLAARVGRTPFYAYDRSLITRRMESLRRVLPKSIPARSELAPTGAERN